MLRVDKTVFISYRRADLPLALLVFKDLTAHGHDVFIDYDGISAGDFAQVIVENIRARAHFLVVLTPTALQRCDHAEDWMRREIETAIDERRNLIPLLFSGFSFQAPDVRAVLTGKLASLSRYNGLEVPLTYFDAAMARLRGQYLAKPLDTVLHPASAEAQQVAQRQRAAAAASPASAVHGAAAAPAPSPSPPSSSGPSAKPAARSTSFPRWFVGMVAAAAIGGGLFIHQRGTKEEAPSPAPAAATAAAPPPPPQASTPIVAPALMSAAQQNARGDDYFYGRSGVAQDDTEAVKWYRKATDQGDARGQSNLGLMFELGRGGLTRSSAEAVKWYRKAAGQGDALGEYFLAGMFERGEGGLAENRAEAIRLYRLAAAQGNPPATEALKRLNAER